MSKAFTKEDGAEERPPVRPRPAGRRLLTPEGHARALAEFTWLRDEERPRLLGEGTAKSLESLHRVEGRLVELGALLESAEVVTPAADAEAATFGAYVTTKDEAGQRTTVRLVGPDEADPREGRVSVASPLGRALLGQRPGDTTTVERPRGWTELQVVAVATTP